MGNKPPIDVFHGEDASIKIPYSTEFTYTALMKIKILKIQAIDKQPKVVFKQCFLLLKYQHASLNYLETFEIGFSKIKYFPLKFSKIFTILSQCPNLKLFDYHFSISLTYPTNEFFTSLYLFMSENNTDQINLHLSNVHSFAKNQLTTNFYLLFISARFVHNVFCSSALGFSNLRYIHFAATSVDIMNRNSSRKKAFICGPFYAASTNKQYHDYCKLLPIFSLASQPLKGTAGKFYRNNYF